MTNVGADENLPVTDVAEAGKEGEVPGKKREIKLKEQVEQLLQDVLPNFPAGDVKDKYQKILRAYIDLTEKDEAEVVRVMREIEAIVVKKEIAPEKSVGKERKEKDPDRKAVIDKLQSHVDFANFLDALPEEMKRLFVQRETATISEKEKIESQIKALKDKATGALERRYWSKILGENLKEHDIVITVLSPTDKYTKNKALNDESIGPSENDNVIMKRRIFTIKHFTAGLLERGVKPEDVNKLNLDYNFKFGLFKIPEAMQEQAGDLQELMNKVCGEVDGEMTEYMLGRVSDVLKRLGNEVENLEGEERNIKQEKIKHLEELRDDLQTNGYRTNYGISEVGPKGDEDKSQDERAIVAVSEAMQAARISSIRESKDKGDYGLNYDENQLAGKIEENVRMEERIKSLSNEITDKKGRSFVIFDSNNALNIDVVNYVRKEKLAVKAGDKNNEAILNLLKKYIENLNVVDVVKPFTMADIGSGDWDGKMEANREATKKLKSLERPEDVESVVKEIQERLGTDEKDERFTSREKFNQQASAINNCSYLSFDKIKVGPELLSSFREAFNAISKIEDEAERKKALRELKLRAGDETTMRLREFRNDIAEKLQSEEYRKRLGLEPGTKIIGDVQGGDEVLLAFDKTKFHDENVLDDLVAELQGKHNIRAVEIVVAEANRDSKSEAGSATRLEEHADALKKLEEETELAKRIEEEIGSLYFDKSLDHEKIKKMLVESGINNNLKVKQDDKGNYKLLVGKKLLSEQEVVRLVERVRAESEIVTVRKALKSAA